jgi:hypothetical protein
LQWVVNYIRNQKEHHKTGTMVERLEQITHVAKAKARPVSTLKRANQAIEATIPAVERLV